jgi:hypothetical protein
MNQVRIGAGLVAAVLVFGGAGWWSARLAASPTPAAEAEAEKPRRVHVDGKALAEATIEVTAALLRDDAKAARSALDRMEKACRRLAPEEDEFFGASVIYHDKALHKVLNGSREYSGAGLLDRTFDEFIWVQRTCRQCHTAAREEGLLPATGPLW